MSRVSVYSKLFNGETWKENVGVITKSQVSQAWLWGAGGRYCPGVSHAPSTSSGTRCEKRHGPGMTMYHPVHRRKRSLDAQRVTNKGGTEGALPENKRV